MTILTSDGVIFCILSCRRSYASCIRGCDIYFFCPWPLGLSVVWLRICMGGVMFRNWLGDHFTIVFDIPRHIYINVKKSYAPLRASLRQFG